MSGIPSFSEVNPKQISDMRVSATLSGLSGKIIGMDVAILHTSDGLDWLSSEQALELRDWINANIPEGVTP